MASHMSTTRRVGANITDSTPHRWTAAELETLIYDALSIDSRAEGHTADHLRAVAAAAGIAGALVSLTAISRRRD